MVGTQFLDLRDPALDIHRTFLNHRSQLQVLRSAGRQPRLFEFIHIPPGTDTAVIRGPCQLLCGQINDKFSRLPDHIIRIPFRPYGHGYHSRVGTDCSDPCRCNNIRFFSIPSAADHDCRQGIEHISRSPVLFFHIHLSPQGVLSSGFAGIHLTPQGAPLSGSAGIHPLSSIR